MMNKDEFDITLNYADELINLPILTKDLVDSLHNLGVEKTEVFDKHIPMVYRIPRYNFLSQVKKRLIDRINRLVDKGIVKKIYKHIGYIESKDEITVICCALIEDKFKNLSPEFLQEVLHNDDPNYRYE